MTDTSHQDGQLANRLAEGDSQALSELFLRHRDRLWRMLNFRLDHRLSVRVDADDVLQEAYLAAAQRIEHYEVEVSPFLWLRTVVMQTLIDVHRRHLGAQMRDAGREVAIDGHRFAQTTSTSLAVCLIAQQTSPSQAAMRAEAFDTVEKAIDGMDPIDREVLALRHFEELTNSEVAETLGIQQKAASIRYIRAVRRLKEILSKAPGSFGDELH